METKELTPEEFQAKVKELEESRNYWMDRATKIENQFAAFRNAVKGTVELIELID